MASLTNTEWIILKNSKNNIQGWKGLQKTWASDPTQRAHCDSCVPVSWLYFLRAAIPCWPRWVSSLYFSTWLLKGPGLDPELSHESSLAQTTNKFSLNVPNLCCPPLLPTASSSQRPPYGNGTTHRLGSLRQPMFSEPQLIQL